MKCRDFREVADSYLSDELLIETNHDVIAHLEACAECRRELAARRELRGKLRAGFQQAPELQMRAEFSASLHDELRTVALRPSRLPFRTLVTRRAAYLVIAASLVIAAVFAFRAIQQRSVVKPAVATGASEGKRAPGKETDPSNPNDAAIVNALLTENAIGDHRDCAINHRLEEAPIDLDEAGRRYDRAYINLVQAVMLDGRLPAGATLVAAHSCIFNGQRFGHVILKYDDQLVSVLVTALDAAPGSERNARRTNREESISSAESGGYRLAHFQTARHAVFVVSGLSETENTTIARAISPAVSRHVAQAERVA